MKPRTPGMSRQKFNWKRVFMKHWRRLLYCDKAFKQKRSNITNTRDESVLYKHSLLTSRVKRSNNKQLQVIFASKDQGVSWRASEQVNSGPKKQKTLSDLGSLRVKMEYSDNIPKKDPSKFTPWTPRSKVSKIIGKMTKSPPLTCLKSSPSFTYACN